jgi:hypothetical protein
VTPLEVAAALVVLAIALAPVLRQRFGREPADPSTMAPGIKRTTLLLAWALAVLIIASLVAGALS